ncbi:hypothetical protein F5B21DRAFT_510140 [Xylaria acuta]|nr:hypothetical protein F5B21DRAFT_510140 [Xylaria acuta]
MNSPKDAMLSGAVNKIDALAKDLGVAPWESAYNTVYDAKKAAAAKSGREIPMAATHSEITTSTVQHIIEEFFSMSVGRVAMQSDLI